MTAEEMQEYGRLSAEELISLLSPGELIEYLIYSYKENPNDFDIVGIKKDLHLKTII